MACLNITPGVFNPGPTWQSSGTANANGATVTNTPGGPSPGCLVSKGSASQFFQKPPSGAVRFIVFGSPVNFVAILTQSGGPGSDTRSVVIVDVSGSTLPTQLILNINAATSVPLPGIDLSVGNGSVFLLRAPDDTNLHASIHRSVDGDVLVSSVPFIATALVTGNATASQLQIRQGTTVVASAALPVGNCNVVTDPFNFPDAVLGPGVAPALAAPVRTETIRNDGSDCLTISGVGNVAPYSVLSSSPAFPVTLNPGQQVQVEIRFAPTALGTFNLDLPVNPTTIPGEKLIRCRGKARGPVNSLSFSSTVTFGTVPLGSSSTRNLVITNSGEATINLTVPSAPIPGTEFALLGAGFSGALTPGASTPAIPISFTPPGEGSFTRVLTFTSDAPGSPHLVTLSGSGCVARARISILVPPGPSINFGQVQRGFRTVKLVRVQNTGSGPLNFRARTSGNALFGIQREGDSITSPLSQANFTVNPVSSCGAGPTGSGEVRFAITFLADAVSGPPPQAGQLIVDNHNAQFGAPTFFTFDLQAEIIAAVNADVELVLDRSGSMDESSGPRKKIDTALDAARLFVQLARPDVDDRVGTSRFNTTPEQVQAITPITSGNQAGMVSDITEPNFSPSGGTAIAGGVIQALRDMNANPRAVPPPQLNKAIVVLTDANDNTAYTNPDDGVSYTLLGENGNTAVSVPADVRLYGVGIGDAVDTGRLAQLCPATGGQFLHVHDFTGMDFFKLEKHFTQIYMATVDLSQISDPTFWIQPSQTHEHPFVVLRGDVTIMVVIYDRDGIRLPFWLLTPKSEIVELTSVPPEFQLRPGITTTARFMEVRLPQGEPDRYAGQWRVVIRHDGKFCLAPGLRAMPNGSDAKEETSMSASSVATQPEWAFGFTSTNCKPNTTDPAMYGVAIGAGSNFRMFPYVEPAIVSIGDPIRLNALVSEFSLPVLHCTVAVEAKAPNGTVSSLTLLDDGGHADGAADDGDYGGQFTHTGQEGMYEFLYRAYGTSRDGEAVVREATLSKYVEGRNKLVPPGHGDDPGTKDDCCTKIQRWLGILAVLLVILIIVAWLGLK
ncbi:MAG: choice-of-anchor D domain-containing protein [Chthoniobacterales bacterium]